MDTLKTVPDFIEDMRQMWNNNEILFIIAGGIMALLIAAIIIMAAKGDLFE